MIQVTWQEDGKQAETFTITDEVLVSFEKYRQTQTVPQQTASGQYASLPEYPGIKEMVVGIFIKCLINPALSMFPPAQIAVLMEQAKTAKDALESAKAAAAQGILTGPAAPAELTAE